MNNHGEFRHSYRRTASVMWCGWARSSPSGLIFSIIWLILEVADQRDDPRTRSEAAMAVAIVVSLVALCLLARYAEREAREDPLLVCPQCDSPLSYYYGVIVLSSGNCPHCGQQVLAD